MTCNDCCYDDQMLINLKSCDYEYRMRCALKLVMETNLSLRHIGYLCQPDAPYSKFRSDFTKMYGMMPEKIRIVLSYLSQNSMERYEKEEDAAKCKKFCELKALCEQIEL